MQNISIFILYILFTGCTIHYISLYDYTVYCIHKPQLVGGCVSKPFHQSNHSSTVYNDVEYYNDFS